jgi:AmmeMemoRadiSam system protein B
MDETPRNPGSLGTAVAGLFYPREPAELRRQVESLLAGGPPPADPPPRALIVPHAGYPYSGAVAAAAYRLLQPGARRIRRVVLLGPSHRVLFDGLAVPASDYVTTPLGSIPVDTALRERALGLPGVKAADVAHQHEHSLEVQLPFLQVLLPGFTVLPIVVGEATDREVFALLESLPLEEPDTLLVVSTDLSHYHDYDTAQGLDRESLDEILALSPQVLDGEHACGFRPLRALLLWARGQGLTPRLLDARNSGDTAGDRHRVVGYAAVSFA